MGNYKLAMHAGVATPKQLYQNPEYAHEDTFDNLFVGNYMKLASLHTAIQIHDSCGSAIFDSMPVYITS